MTKSKDWDQIATEQFNSMEISMQEEWSDLHDRTAKRHI